MEQFCSVSGAASAVAVIVFLVFVYVMNHLPKKKFSFATRVLIGTGCGTVFGLLLFYGDQFLPGGVLGGTENWFSLVSTGYLALFRLLIAPAVFIATIRMVLHTPAYKVTPKEVKVKKWVNTLMLALASAVSLGFGIFFHVGSREGGIGPVEMAEGINLTEVIGRLVPSNLALDALLGNVVAVFVAAVFVGIAARRMSGKYMDTVKPFFDVTEAAFSILGSVCKTIIAYKPAGAFAIMTALTASEGLGGIWQVVKFLLVLTLAAAVMLVLQLLLSAVCGVSPAAFLKAGKVPMMKALKTRSGSACLPEAQAALSEGLGLNKEITDDVAAYAIASGMQGCGALFPTMALIFSVNMAGGSWSLAALVTAVVVIVLASYGITGVPGTATMAEFAVVMGSGMESAVSGLGPMIAIDPIGDVPRTLINVTGCMTNAIIVERKVRVKE